MWLSREERDFFKVQGFQKYIFDIKAPQQDVICENSLDLFD
jgi:hypothetical protein